MSCFSWSLELSKGVPHSLTPSLAPSLSSCFLLLLLLRLLTASSFCQLVVTTNGPEPERKLRMQLGTPGPEPYPDQDAWYLSQAPDEHMPERMPKMPERVVEKTYFATFFPQKWPEMTDMSLPTDLPTGSFCCRVRITSCGTSMEAPKVCSSRARAAGSWQGIHRSHA